MPKTTHVAEVMTSRVRSLGPDAKLSEVRQLLHAEACHHVPVVDADGRLVGIVSTRDLIRLLRGAPRVPSPEIDAFLGRRTVREVMSRDPVTLGLADDVDRAVDLIADGRIHSVPVVDTDGRLAGIVTDTDLLAYLG